MRLNILIGGKAGQGINKTSGIVSSILTKQGYFTFNYRDYQSLIRGGHNFNILSFSDKRIGSYESKVDGIVALDDNTLKLHKSKLRKKGFIIDYKGFEKFGMNLNVALAGVLCSVLGIDKKILVQEVKEQLNNVEAIKAAETGYSSGEKRFELKKLENKVKIMTGSQAISEGAIKSGIDFYFAYPMTPATPVLHELAATQKKFKHKVFQPENEIAVINMALGCSFTGKKVMIGTSGGGFDLMSEALSLQGQSEIPLVVYLASRPGPGTGVPTYSMQGDLDVALRAGHGEFPRVVIAPGDPVEAQEKVNEAFYLAEKFRTLAIILADKHLAESEFSFNEKLNRILKVKIKRDIPGEKIVKASSYEHDKFGNTTEDAELTRKNVEKRLEKYEKIKKEAEKFEMVKIYGNKKSKNLVIGWGSTKWQILDAIQDLDCKFMQVLYLKPLSYKIKNEMLKARNMILVEQNVTGQLGRLLREKTGLKIEEKNRILKYDARPFASDELREEIKKRLV